MSRRTVASGSAARMTSPITAMPCAPAARQAARLLSSMPARATTGPAEQPRRLGERVEPERRAIAGFADGQEDRAQGDVIGAGGELRRRLLRRVRRDADQPVRQPPSRRCRIAAARQMHAVGAGRDRRLDIVMHDDSRAVAVAERDQRAQQVAALGRRQVLLPQAEPAAAAAKRRLGDLRQRPLRLAAIGDDEKGRGGKPHEPHVLEAPTPTLPRKRGRELPGSLRQPSPACGGGGARREAMGGWGHGG